MQKRPGELIQEKKKKEGSEPVKERTGKPRDCEFPAWRRFQELTGPQTPGPRRGFSDETVLSTF